MGGFPLFPPKIYYEVNLRKKTNKTIWIVSSIGTIIIITIIIYLFFIPKVIEGSKVYSCDNLRGVICEQKYEPVCANNNKTYSSDCVACQIEDFCRAPLTNDPYDPICREATTSQECSSRECMWLEGVNNYTIGTCGGLNV